jgi:Lrp/AsnC family transcriptional regulator for asnA, asnC and gidA
MMGIKVSGDAAKVAEAVGAIPAADYVVLTAGTFDLLAEVVCEDDDDLIELGSRIRAIDGVRSVDTLVYLKLHKQLYDWGTR